MQCKQVRVKAWRQLHDISACSVQWPALISLHLSTSEKNQTNNPWNTFRQKMTKHLLNLAVCVNIKQIKCIIML